MAWRELGAVVAMDVFEHIPLPDLRDLLDLIHDRLEPGGVLIFRVPNMASPLALMNYFGDLSHATAMNEVSIRQLVFETRFTTTTLFAEPLAYPRSLSVVIGIVSWWIYRSILGSALRAFGIRAQVLTPNLVCRLEKSTTAADPRS